MGIYFTFLLPKAHYIFFFIIVKTKSNRGI